MILEFYLFATPLQKFIMIKSVFLYYLAMGITANCICEIFLLALDGFDLNAVHKLSSNEKKSRQSQSSNPRLLGGRQDCFLCATQPPPPKEMVEIII